MLIMLIMPESLTLVILLSRLSGHSYCSYLRQNLQEYAQTSLHPSSKVTHSSSFNVNEHQKRCTVSPVSFRSPTGSPPREKTSQVRHPDQRRVPPQLTPFNVEELWPYFRV
ncbi:hypothetical protein ILYODFUR_016843 [Ilyodon furcidens]|uniref:Secreted protein n=1 Tax=Ilyodon furcidens TaxID=33524 RepID=A0ABV0UJT3_9TELE